MNSPTRGFTVAGAWGKAFKLPSLYALGHPLVGNPDLVPERGESYELELSQQLLDGKARWSATWFDGEFRNAIDFDSGPPPMLVNRNRVDTRASSSRGSLGVGEQWHARRQRHEREEPHRFHRAASCATGRSGARASARTGRRARRSSSRRRPPTWARRSIRRSRRAMCDLPAYTRVDVSAVWQLSPRFETYLAIDNLTDQQYEQFVGFEVRGIAPRLGREVQL